MDQSRRAYLRGLGGVGLGVVVAGCSSDGDGGGDSGGGSASGGDAADDPSGSGGSETAGGTGDGATETRSDAKPETAGKDPAATGLSGTVGSKSVGGLTFVEYDHYAMNGVQGVVGRVKNTSDAAFDSVTVHVTVKPGDVGPFTETASDSLEPGDTWRFKFRFGDGAPEEVEGYTIWATGEKA